MSYSLTNALQSPVARTLLTFAGFAGLVGGADWAVPLGAIPQAPQVAIEWHGVAFREIDTDRDIQRVRVHHLPVVISATSSNATGPGLVATMAASATV